METVHLILAHEQALLAAIREQDIQQLDRLLHEDLLFTLPTGQLITKADDLASYRAGHLVVTRLQASPPHVRVVAATAVVAVTIALEGTYQGQPLAGTYQYLRVWQQTQAAWQVIAGSCVPVST